MGKKSVQSALKCKKMSNFIRYLKFLLVLGYFLVRNCFCHNFISTANFIRR